MSDVLITGLGVVSPIGIGAAAVRDALVAKRSGVRRLPPLEAAGWPIPIGADIADFEPKRHVQPRKSLKVMAREIQLAFAAGELAWADAGFEETPVEPERVGVVGAAGLIFCPLEELADAYRESIDDANDFDLRRWGAAGMGKLYPLWMLKHLPNLAACHVGIRRQALGPTNTIAQGDVSGLLAIGEAADTIRRGAADVMLAGGATSRIDLTDLAFRGGAGLSRRIDDPAGACRPFDAQRDGSVAAEGAAYFVLESRDHAERRGFTQRGGEAWGRLASVACRFEPTTAGRGVPSRAIAASATAALDGSEAGAASLAMVKAHGAARIDSDAAEAAALAPVVGDAPVTAPTSFLGSSGAACGAVELAAALIGWREGIVPATLNHTTPDPACPLSVSAEHCDATGDALLAVNHAVTGQAVAAVVTRG
ncbi:MAG: beta-ketoacyl synthase N-terminal-like domain-containing protein [Planctomycetota bacterium]